MYTVTELAAKAGCSRTYIKAEIRIGRLPARRIGNQYQITNAAARAWLAKPRRGSRIKTNTQGE
jgi:excisionase family DNA binding protein